MTISEEYYIHATAPRMVDGELLTHHEKAAWVAAFVEIIIDDGATKKEAREYANVRVQEMRGVW